ncbi:hypothetical protein FHR91_001968 [Erythrobacter lutimaris]|nr:hypothetical protein [Alteriqipengyuania lutimaris]
MIRDAAPGDFPDDFAAACERAFRKQSRRWLAWQAAMVVIGGALRDESIDHVFLKGAALNLVAYPEGGQRPLRDLDLLVRPPDAERAQRIIMSMGYRRLPGVPEEITSAAYQMPLLRHPRSGLAVEVHRALIRTDRFDFRALASMLLETAQDHDIAAKPVRCAAPIPLYCHLLLHAGLKSRFDCGPLVLADLAFLHARYPELRDEFARAAQSFGLARTEALLSQVLIRHSSLAKRAGSNPAPVSRGLVDHVAALLVLPPDTIRARKFARDLQEDRPLGRKLLALLAGALRPSRAKISAATGIDADARLVWLHYPAWLFDRSRLILAGKADRGFRSEVNRDLELHQWLAADLQAADDRGQE